MTKHIKSHKLSSSGLFHLFFTMEDSQVIIQPSDLIILPVIEKATILSGQKSKAEKTRKKKEGKTSREKERWSERAKRRKSVKRRLPDNRLLDLFSLSAILDHHWAEQRALPPESCGICFPDRKVDFHKSRAL